MKQRLQEPHDEGVANHIAPESCAAGREVRREALTGAGAGWVLSREISYISGADAVHMSGRQHGRRDNASAGPTRRGQKGPHARTETSCARTGRSGNRPPWMARRAAMGRPEAESQR